MPVIKVLLVKISISLVGYYSFKPWFCNITGMSRAMLFAKEHFWCQLIFLLMGESSQYNLSKSTVTSNGFCSVPLWKGSFKSSVLSCAHDLHQVTSSPCASVSAPTFSHLSPRLVSWADEFHCVCTIHTKPELSAWFVPLGAASITSSWGFTACLHVQRLSWSLLSWDDALN